MKAPKSTGTGLGMAAPKNGNGHNGNGLMVPISICAAIIMALLQAFWGVAWSGINANIARIEEQTLLRQRTIEQQFLRIREHEEFTKRLDAQITKIEAGLKDIATRDEVNTRLGINSNSILQVRSDVDTLKRDLGQTYSIKDALKDLQDQLKVLQNRTWQQPPK